MGVDTEPEVKAWSWFISLVAVGLLAWGVAELLGVGSGEPGSVTMTPISGEMAATSLDDGTVALHRLLPDATDDLGRLVSVDGTVLGDASTDGFWVRDLRDNIVFVGAGHDVEGARPRVEAGDAVRVVGRVALLSADEQADRLEQAGLVVPASAMVIRDVKVVPAADGIELLQE